MRNKNKKTGNPHKFRSYADAHNNNDPRGHSKSMKNTASMKLGKKLSREDLYELDDL